MGSFRTRKLSFFLYCVFFFFFFFLRLVIRSTSSRKKSAVLSPQGTCSHLLPPGLGLLASRQGHLPPKGNKRRGREENPTHSKIAETQTRIGTFFLVSSSGGDTVILEGHPAGDGQRRMEDRS